MHLLTVMVAQPSRVVSDDDLVLTDSSLVLSTYIQDTIGIKVKSVSDLRNTPWCM
jgi:hypothetical protein